LLGIARIAENGLIAAAAIAAAIAFLGIITFDMSVLIGLLLTPVAIMLSSAALAFVLLRHQEQAAITTALISAVLVVAAALVSQLYSTQILIFTVICWLGSLVVASVLRQTVSLKLAVLATVPVTVVVGLFGLMFKGQITHFFQSMWLKSLEKFSETELQRLDPQRQAQLFNTGGFQQEFHSLRLGKEAVIAFAISIGLSVVFSLSLFAIIASALTFVFFIQGLSVLHCITKQRGLSRNWLIGMYAILWLPLTMILLSILGMADNFFRLRKI